jgi:hypothetical protein
VFDGGMKKLVNYSGHQQPRLCVDGKTNVA